MYADRIFKAGCNLEQRNELFQQDRSGENIVKIAYLVLIHKDPAFLARLCKRVMNHTENHVFVHVDAKADSKPFRKSVEKIPSPEKVHFVHNIPVYWGGYNSVEATIILLKEAANYRIFDRYVLLQGMDYPLWNNLRINDFFRENRQVEFINAVSETMGPRKEWHKYFFRYYLDGQLSIPKRLVNKCNTIVRKMIPQIMRRPWVLEGGKKLEIFRGWTQFALTDSAVRFVIDWHDVKQDYNHYFKHVYAADESYFHTILYNSPFAERTQNGAVLPEANRSIKGLLNLTYFEYPNIVTLFKEEQDYEYLLSKGYPYFRKASSESKGLLDKIDKECEAIENSEVM